MLKDVARFIVLIMLFNMLPAPVWAQQPSAPASKPTPPQLNVFVWKNLNVSPLVPPKLLPEGYGVGDEAKDIDVLQQIAGGAKGYEEASRLFWAGVDIVFFRGTGVHPQFKKELTERILASRMSRETFSKGFLFYPYGMAWGSEASDGTYHARFTGNPLVDFDEPLEVYMIDPLTIPSGPYMGLSAAPIIPVKCINLTGMEAVDTQGQLPAPPPPPPPTMYKVTVINRYVDERGKKAKFVDEQGKKVDAPSRQQLQARIETEAEGEQSTSHEMWDNKKVEFEVPEGRRIFREVLDGLKADDLRFVSPNPLEVEVNRNTTLEFVKTLIPELEPEPTTLAQAMCADCKGEKGDPGRDGRDGKGMPKWMKIALPIIGGVAAAALFLPKGGEKIVVTEAQKGLNNPGGSPP